MLTDAVNSDISRDWTAAREVQRRFMEHAGHTAGTLDYEGRCRQMRELGGDFYDFMPLGDDRLAIAVGDASGKGLSAALMISNVQSSLRTAVLLTGSDAPVALQAVNRQVYESSLAERYATLFYGVIDGRTRMLRYVNAGHNPPLVIRRDGSVVWLETGGAPVGMFRDCVYQEGAVQLMAGDMILAYTDGVTEAENPDGEQWGVEEFRTAAVTCEAPCASELVRTLFRSMDDFSHGCQSDDATVVAVQVH